MPKSILETVREKGRPLVLGHRGASGHAPENTLSAFRRAAEMGADAVELDVHLTKDGHLVVIHDDTVERTTNGKGPVAALTLAEIRALDAGAWFEPAYAGERVPTLDEALAWGEDAGLPVVIEVKPARNPEPLVAALVALVDRLDAGERVAFVSFDHFIVRGIKKRKPHWLAGALYLGRVVDPVGLAGAALADGLLPYFGFLAPDLVEAAHREGLWVGTWAPDSEAELKHSIAMGADMIGTNYPDRLIRLLK